MTESHLPIPPHFQPRKVGEVWSVPYGELAEAAEKWAIRHRLSPANEDTFRVGLLLVDIQNTFCIPGFELFVRGQSGSGAVDDNCRLCQFIYRNLGRISRIVASLDTHNPIQLFHSVFLVDQDGSHPSPYTVISLEDIEGGRWRIDPQVCRELKIEPDYGQQHILRYTRQLRKEGKYDWTIWPYHALQGGIGHALVSAIEEAIFFHSLARKAQPRLVTKGTHPLTESYSAFGPEVQVDDQVDNLEPGKGGLVEVLAGLDMLIVAGQAKSHCLAWTVRDLLETGKVEASKVYLLEDCTSPVVVPGAVDYSDEAAAAFVRFNQEGAHLVRSIDPMDEWPGIMI